MRYKKRDQHKLVTNIYKQPSHFDHHSFLAQKPCLSSMWQFRHLGNANSPALHPSTLQKKGPLWEAMCSRMVFTNLNTLEHVGQVSCSTVGGGPCLTLRCTTSTCLVEYPLALLAPMPLLFTTTLLVEIKHGPRGQYFSTLVTRPPGIPSEGLHVVA